MLIRRLILVAGIVALAGCMNHYLIHPETPPSTVITWTEEVERGELLIHLEGARPAGEGVHPGVLVHPEAGHEAVEMRGILSSLAERGYVAVAADYRRRIDGKFRRTMFAWRDREDPLAALGLLRDHPHVDPERIAALGYSQGGVFSLLIAASAPEDIRAVVAYYPVTDFEHWLNTPHRNPIRRLVFRMIRWHFRRQSGAQTDEEFRLMLDRASAYKQAESIRAPVLLIHGDEDTSAPLAESERLAGRLRELGRPVELLVIEDAGHVFNFRETEQARRAWEAAVGWLGEHLKTPGRAENFAPEVPAGATVGRPATEGR
jgi:dipeptidyl aminopeptidase/acylaminoacyl peptidase